MGGHDNLFKHQMEKYFLNKNPKAQTRRQKIGFDNIKIKDPCSMNHSIDYVNIWVAD